jgi:MFS family permease
MFSRYYNERLKGFKNIFRSLQYQNYRYFFAGQGISLIGTWIQRIAMPWLVYDLTHSALLLGTVAFVGQLPTFFSPLAGVITDRWNRYHLIIVTQILSMIQAFVLAILFFMGILAIWHIIVLSILLGCVNAFDVPARQSLLIDMIEKKEDLSNAIALNSTIVNGARLIGPSIAGMLIAFTGEGTCFLINGISYLAVIYYLIKMKVAPQNKNKNKKSYFKELSEGFHYTFSFLPIKYVIMLLALVSLMGMPYTVLMPIFAKEILHGSSHTFGFLMGASGMGALFGAIYLASRKSVFGLEKLIPLSSTIFGTGLVLFSFSRSFVLSLFLMVIIGGGMMLQMASSNTVLQTIVDDDKRGRVMSFYTMAFMGTIPFGSWLSGFLAEKIGTSNTVLAGGVACILGAIFYMIKFPKLKKEIYPIYAKLGIGNNPIS